MASKPSDSTTTTHSLNRQQVLEEDEYTAALSEIIARDFFPSLVHLDATNSYLDALQSEDTQLINASVRRLQDLATPQALASQRAIHPSQTPGCTPYGIGPSDTPVHTPRAQNGLHGGCYDSSLSLDSFQAKYTSEDNASFTEILDEENRTRKEKWGWAWEAQKRARDVKAIEMDKRNRLFIEDTTSQPPGVRERLAIEIPQVKLITAGPPQERSDCLSNEDEHKNGVSQALSAFEKRSSETTVQLSNPLEADVMAPKKDTRSAAVDGWSFKTRNSLMFTPDADISPYNGPTSLSTSQPKGPPKQIKHDNTRLPEQSNEDGETADIHPSSPTQSKIGAAIAGTSYVSHPARTDFPLLPSLPSPTPSELGAAAVNKLMTWGTITSTPRVLSSHSSVDPASASIPTTPFHLPGPTQRERVAHKLSSTASRSLRAKASLLSGTPGPLKLGPPRNRREIKEPSTPRPHPGLLTPAARRLLDRTAGLGTSASRRAEVMQHQSHWEGVGKTGEPGNVRWTPSPAHATRRMA
ncbi:hypothetical protein K439DRAFT_1640455 [Ramaria rubella]|nr:hypothetical protein K439DRAFT_1640455 [Ramaria rubella]